MKPQPAQQPELLSAEVKLADGDLLKVAGVAFGAALLACLVAQWLAKAWK